MLAWPSRTAQPNGKISTVASGEPRRHGEAGAPPLRESLTEQLKEVIFPERHRAAFGIDKEPGGCIVAEGRLGVGVAEGRQQGRSTSARGPQAADLLERQDGMRIEESQPTEPSTTLDASRTFNAADLASDFLAYRLEAAPRRKLQLSNAKRLADLQRAPVIEVEGVLLAPQGSKLAVKTGKREIRVLRRAYTPSPDRSVRLRVGSVQSQPHVQCKVHLADPWLVRINSSLGTKVKVSGVVRCSFRQAGFVGAVADAHLFEINPVTKLELMGEMLEIPLPPLRASSVQGWASDGATARSVRYGETADVLTFVGGLQNPEYVQLPGMVLDGEATTFTLTAQDDFVTLRVLPASSLGQQLESHRDAQVVVSGLYSIDLAQALTNRFTPSVFVLEVSDRLDVSAPGVRDVPSKVDLLGFAPLVDGLYALLNDHDTTLPITIGITAPWGAGKSSAMLQLRERLASRPLDALTRMRQRIRKFFEADQRVSTVPGWFVVNFDAWKYETSLAIWTALAKKIYDDARSQMTYLERVNFRLRLEFERLELWRFLVRGLGPPAIIAAVGALAAALGGVLQHLGAIAGGGGALALALAATGWNWGVLGDPFRRALDDYAKQARGGRQTEFSPEADRDVRTFTKVLTNDLGRCLAVFVDDLDRCSSRSVVGVVEAINQIFNADQDSKCVFVLGMDRDMVVSSIDVAYQQTIDYLQSHGSLRAANFGESFLAKVVQLCSAAKAGFVGGIDGKHHAESRKRREYRRHAERGGYINSRRGRPYPLGRACSAEGGLFGRRPQARRAASGNPAG